MEQLLRVIDTGLKNKGISAAKASTLAVGNPSMIKNIRLGRKPSFEAIEKLFAVLDVNLQYGFRFERPLNLHPENWQIPDNPGKVQLYGYAGAGGEIAYDGEFHHGEVAPAPPGNEKNLAAVEVRGDSASPFLREGDIVYFYPDYPANPKDHIGRLVLATTIGGAAYIKILRRGDAAGKWNLQSINPRHPLMEDMELQRISPFVWIHCNGRENPFKRV